MVEPQGWYQPAGAGEVTVRVRAPAWSPGVALAWLEHLNLYLSFPTPSPLH